MVERQQRDKQLKIQRDHERKKTFCFKITFSGFGLTDRSQKTKSRSDQRYEEEACSRQCRRAEEENKGDQRAQAGGDQQGGGDDEDRRRRDDGDEESDQESDSEEDEERNDEANRNQTNRLHLNIVCVNFRSVNNKVKKLKGLLRRNNLHILILTETWLNRDTADKFLRSVLPKNYSYVYFAREGRGGGVAIIYSNELEGNPFNLGSRRSFEYVSTVLQHTEWRRPVLFVAVYHRTARNLVTFDTFLKEFEEFLKDALKKYTSLVIAGDFNIHVDNQGKTDVKRFQALLEDFGLVQHVNVPTHQAGHTLDLVISRNFNIFGLDVRNNNISDHFTIYFMGKPASEKEHEQEDEEEDEEDERIKR